jgi:hypothetical protein
VQHNVPASTAVAATHNLLGHEFQNYEQVIMQYLLETENEQKH